MDLADPEQILSLTKSSRNPSVSFNAAYAEKHQFHINHGKVEELMRLDADLVIAGFYWRNTQTMLKKFERHVETLEQPKSISEIKDHIRTVASLLNQPARGDALINDVNKALKEAEDARQGDPIRAGIFYSGGYTQGAKTYFDNLLQVTGFSNISVDAGIEGSGTVPLEKLIALRPELIFHDRTARERGDRLALTYLAHPALHRAIPKLGRQHLPFETWLCGGRATIAALETLTKIRREFNDRPRTKRKDP